ncbi:MAG: hypothetical protein ACE37B_10950 [Ilumatobacter sp.]|uniref:hypothetical protein n=1 Tax=Ilumatobacter sp. TaxID=1967498 RepID=UPI00391A7A89
MYQGAVIQEQGVTFGVLVVKPSVLNSSTRDQMVNDASRAFGNIPAVLMAQDHRGTPSYYGRQDISKFMANVPLAAVPWRRYRLE